MRVRIRMREIRINSIYKRMTMRKRNKKKNIKKEMRVILYLNKLRMKMILMKFEYILK